MKRTVSGLAVFAVLFFAGVYACAENHDSRNEVLHARALLDAAGKNYADSVTRHIPRYYEIENVMRGIREWAEAHKSDRAAQAFWADYLSRRAALRGTARLVDIPADAKFLTPRQKELIAKIAVLSDEANMPLFALFRHMIKTP